MLPRGGKCEGLVAAGQVSPPSITSYLYFIMLSHRLALSAVFRAQGLTMLLRLHLPASPVWGQVWFYCDGV